MDIQNIEVAANKIKENDSKIKKIAKTLRSANINILNISAVEKNLVYKTPASRMEKLKILAVDGGLSQQSYHGLDMILVRSVAAVFEYDGILKRIAYYPSASPEPKLELSDKEEESVNTGMIRQKHEVVTAIEAIKKYSPDIVFMDGPLIPHNRIKKESSLYQNFSELMTALKKLYSCPALIAGCVEDSKGMEACKIISDAMKEKNMDGADIVSETRDSVFLYNLLEQGERTFVFKRTDAILNELGKDMYSFYIKPAEFDRPLRIDFIAQAKTEKIASAVMCTCANSTYGFPIPLIEADMRAKLGEKDVESVRDLISDMTGMPPSLMKLRRNIRPF